MYIKNSQTNASYFRRKKIMARIESRKLITLLKEQLNGINRDFEQIITENDPTLLTHKPSEKEWSAIECFQHLYLTNKYYLLKIRETVEKAKAAGASPKETFKSGFLGNYMYNTMKPKNGEVTNKTGTFKSVDPNKKYANTTLDVQKVIENFKKQQREFGELLSLVEEVGLDSGRVPSLIGPIMSFKPGDALKFLLAHEERHLIQAKNAIPQPA